jgi:diaminobutyrate-2-oxoglutarate transaminase
MTNGLESEVRYYCRDFPAVFARAEGSWLYTDDGRPFLDFFSAAGSLNYGHNHPAILEAVIEHLRNKSIISALDMDTPAKLRFMERFDEIILRPRGMKFKFQFTGPTGTNAVEAAIKLARKATGRRNIFAFFGAFHGMTLGSLAATGGLRARAAAGIGLPGVTFMPFPQGFMATFDTIKYMEEVLDDSQSGVEKPAAVICETVQAEGGVNVPPPDWLARLRELCTRHEILLICDDIQVGCGRTGRFFSFEHSGIVPDIIVLSKSLSGLGVPLSLVLLREEIDVWKPGEHTGTFRGSQLGLAGGTAALDTFWTTPGFEQTIADKQQTIESFLTREFSPLAPRVSLRGLGMIQGVCFEGKEGPELASKIQRRCFERGLIIETAGRGGRVIKLLPALTIENKDLLKGLEILKESVIECC